MRGACLILALSLASATAGPSRITGGDLTTIDRYPTIVSMLYSSDLSIYRQSCGGTIINTRSILTAAHCTVQSVAQRWRARVGSTWANSDGIVHSIQTIINHPQFSPSTYDSDISIVRTASAITYVNDAVRPGTFAGANYNTGDNAVVWAAGWGLTSEGGQPSEQLRHVQVWTVNQATCNQRYRGIITSNMLCSGWLDVGGRDQCSQDSGGPLYHNGIVVGVSSFGMECGSAYYPGINTRVSMFSTWIQANA